MTDKTERFRNELKKNEERSSCWRNTVRRGLESEISQLNHSVLKILENRAVDFSPDVLGNLEEMSLSIINLREIVDIFAPSPTLQAWSNFDNLTDHSLLSSLRHELLGIFASRIQGYPWFLHELYDSKPDHEDPKVSEMVDQMVQTTNKLDNSIKQIGIPPLDGAITKEKMQEIWGMLNPDCKLLAELVNQLSEYGKEQLDVLIDPIAYSCLKRMAWNLDRINAILGAVKHAGEES